MSNPAQTNPGRNARATLAKLMSFGLGGAQVDTEKKTIRNYAIMSRGEALGHGMWVDAETLMQVETLGRQLGEIKTRYTHPGLCEDGLANQIGNTSGFTVMGSKVIGDAIFYAEATPTKQEKINDILLMAKQDPKKFGASIVFTPDYDAMDEFSLKNGGMWAENSWGEKYVKGFKSPDKENVNNYPHVRIAELHASDFVGDPAANKDGLFGKHQALAVAGEKIFDWLFGRSNEVPESEMLAGIEPARVQKFFAAYCARHGLNFSKGAHAMSKKFEETPEAPEKKPVEDKDKDGMAEGEIECPHCHEKFVPEAKAEDADPKKGEMDEEPDNPAVKKDITPASEKCSGKSYAEGLAEGEAKQRAYAKGFENILTASGFNAGQREEFRAKYFGKPLDVVQEFANLKLAASTVPAGEGGAVTAKDAKETAEAAGELEQRWNNNERLRQEFGVKRSDKPESEAWKKGFGEYVAGNARAEKYIVSKGAK